MILRRCWFFALILAASPTVKSQDADSLLTASALSSQDTLTIIGLIDSLLQLEDELGSQLGIRLGYNSNVLSAGRTLGIENFGLAPGLTYYHKSGFYADVTGYWSKDFEPTYYLTVASLGYMKDVSPHFSFLVGYDRYFYSTAQSSNYIPYKNTVSITPILEFKPVSFSANYSFYFGDQQAHRIMPGLTFTLEKKKLWIIDRIALLPSAYMLLGNETITTIEYVEPKTLKEALENWRKYNMRWSLKQTDTHVFGIMNYTFTVPLSITIKNWNLIFTYAYNIPKALPGEPLTISESSYISGSLTYFIDLKPNKKLL